MSEDIQKIIDFLKATSLEYEDRLERTNEELDPATYYFADGYLSAIAEILELVDE